eukprot:2041300-Pleurochrysis_carterae.AAC.1
MSYTHRGGRDGVPPHLLHPPLHHALGVGVRAQPEREVEPARRQRAQLVQVDQKRRRANRLQLLGGAFGPVPLDDVVLRRLRVHVAEDVRGGLRRRRQVGDGLHEHVVGLEHQNEGRRDLREQRGRRQEL